MMSRIGNKRAFGLVEVMVATSVLAVGVVFVYQTFFVSLDLFEHYARYLKIAPWMQEQVWQAQESLRHRGSLSGPVDVAQEFKDQGMTWDLDSSLIDQAAGLYKIDLAVSWREGNKKRTLLTAAYALQKKQE